MRRIVLCCAVLMLAFAATGVGQETPAPASKHVIIKPADIKWGDPPPVFEKGATFAVLSGDPAAAGPFVVRMKMPAGYKINPHWHPTDEHVTLISGTCAVGMGEKFDTTTMTTLSAGGYVLLPADMRHYVMTKTATIVQINAMGPFQLTYVNQQDDPSTRGVK